MRARAACRLLAVAAVLCVPQVLLADYTSILHNLTGSPNDTSFDGSVLRIVQSPANNLTLYTNAGQKSGSVTDCSVNMYTTLQYYDPSTSDPNYPSGYAWFEGGFFSLSFMFDGLGPYSISGPIDVFKVGVTEVKYPGTSYATSTVTGEGRWEATTVNLPGPDQWVTGPDGWSGIHSLTLAIGTDLSNWDWSGQFNRGNTQYNISPRANAIPEPAAALLLLLGGAGLLRRRGA